MGLNALKEVIRAFQFEAEKPKKEYLKEQAEIFLPYLEQKMQQVIGDQENPHQLKIMIAVLKIFYMMNSSQIQTCLTVAFKIEWWIDIIHTILGS